MTTPELDHLSVVMRFLKNEGKEIKKSEGISTIGKYYSLIPISLSTFTYVLAGLVRRTGGCNYKDFQISSEFPFNFLTHLSHIMHMFNILLLLSVTISISLTFPNLQVYFFL